MGDIDSLMDLKIVRHWYCVTCGYRQPDEFETCPDCNSTIIEQELAGDLVFGPDGEPEYLTGEDVVLQDCRDIIQDTGLDEKMIGANADEIYAIIQEVKTTLEEQDDRLVPGETEVAENEGEHEITVTLDNGSTGSFAL